MKPMLNSSARAFDGMANAAASAQPSKSAVAQRIANAMRTSETAVNHPKRLSAHCWNALTFHELSCAGFHMRRREFITLLSAAAAWPLAARAQQPEGIRRVGVLTPKQDFADRNDVATITQEFQHLGWEEGRNFHLEYRAASPNEDELRSAAADLMGMKPEVILAVTSPALKAAQNNTDTIPIVFVAVTDPVNRGFVADRAHPGGNVTGFTAFDFSIGSTWLKLLKEISPNLRHFALVFNPETTPGGWLPLFKSAAPVVGLEVNEAAVNDDDGIDNILNAMRSSSLLKNS